MHALAAATRARLDEHGEADARRLLGQSGVGLVVAVVAGQHRDTDLDCDSPCGSLVAQRAHRRWWRTDPDQTGGYHGRREVGVLGQEAVAGVDRVGAGGQRGREDRVTIEV